MRTIAINPTRRRKVAKRRSRKRAPARRRASAKKANPVRRRKRSNPKAGISPQELRALGMAAMGGAAAGAFTNYLDQAKPAFLASVPTEGVAIIAGAVMTAFGKTPAIKNLAIGMVAYGAGELASRLTGPGTFAAPAAALPAPGVSRLVHSNPYHSTGIVPSSSAHVGNLLVTVKE
jgi:hypothetical protein